MILFFLLYKLLFMAGFAQDFLNAEKNSRE